MNLKAPIFLSVKRFDAIRKVIEIGHWQLPQTKNEEKNFFFSGFSRSWSVYSSGQMPRKTRKVRMILRPAMLDSHCLSDNKKSKNDFKTFSLITQGKIR